MKGYRSVKVKRGRHDDRAAPPRIGSRAAEQTISTWPGSPWTPPCTGQSLGAELLVDALGRIIEAARSRGSRLIVVDALDDQATAFYRRHDFTPVAGTMRLYLKVATTRAALEP